MLEGNEVEKQIGKSGKVIVDVTGDGFVKANVGFKEGAVDAGLFINLDLIELMHQAADKTGNALAKTAVDGFAKMLGR